MAILSVKRRKQLTYFVIGLVFLLGGIEYAVILPTLWLYLETRFHAEEYFLGLILAAFCFSGLFSGPIMGRWSDVTRKTKVILLFANCWEIAGNIMYFFGVSKWFLFAGRLVAGVGAGVGATLIAELARVTSAEKRTGMLSMFIAIRQLGLLIGPGFNLFLRELHFYIGNFLVDKYSSPGAFMAVLWCLLQLVVLCCYTELSVIADAEAALEIPDSGTVTVSNNLSVPKPCSNSSRTSQNKSIAVADTKAIITGSSVPSCQGILDDEEFRDTARISASCPQASDRKLAWLEHEDWHNSSDLIESAERYMVSEKHLTSSSFDHVRPHACQEQRTVEVSGKYGSLGSVNGEIQNQTQDKPENPPKVDVPLRTGRVSYPWKYYYDEYMREPVVVLLGIQFISYFNQVALETMITPLTEKYLNWGELENSLMYCAAGALVIAVFFLVRWLSQRLLDRTMILIGCTLLTIATGWLVWVIPNAVPGSPSQNLPKFIVGLILDLFALPFLIVCSVSLYSKITRKETQGFSQGLRRSVAGVATIMGPLWAGSTLPWPYLMMGVMCGLITVALIMLLVSFKSLNLAEDVDEQVVTRNPHSLADEGEERRPLLS